MGKIIAVREHFDLKLENNWLHTWNYSKDGIRYSHYSLSGQRWSSILRRTKSNGNYQESCPSYEGCVNNFSNFQNFVEWSKDQYGYDFREYMNESSWAWQIDKDILGCGKEYSESSCIFVPHQVNTFVTFRKADKVVLPIGVTYNKRDDRYVSQISMGKGEKRIRKYFLDPFEAHRYWQYNKLLTGEILCEKYKDHTKLINGLENILNDIRCDYDNFKETI